jgi:hypothetical protein
MKMGASFCVIFEADVPPHGTLGGDNGSLNRHQEQLAQLASECGLVSVGEFESYDPDEFEDFLDEGEAGELPPVQWFEASAGLAAVRALISHLDSHPDSVSGQAVVLTDLASVESELSDAERHGVQFRFAVVP